MSANATANDETQVNTTSAGEQLDASIIALADGGWVVVWTQSIEAQENQIIEGQRNITVFQRYGANGAPLGAETQVSLENTVSGQIDPVVTALADGGFVIAWEDQFAGEGDSGVFTQRYDAKGVAKGSIEVLSTSTTINGTVPSITTLDDGGWVVTWSESGGILQQRFDAQGAGSGTVTQVNSLDGGDVEDAFVSALSDGGWVVTWQDEDSAGNGVFLQRFDKDGNKIGSQSQVNLTSAAAQQDVVVTGLVGGGWVVAWESGGDQDGESFGVYQMRFGADGVALTGEVLVNSTTGGNQSDASVTALADGGWVVAWEGDDQDGDGSGIYLQRYDADGDRVGSETLVNAGTADDQTKPVVTALPSGGFVVSWVSEGQDGDASGVFQRVFAADVKGTANADTLKGSAFDETLKGLAGNDILNGKAGADRLEGGAGNDTYVIDNAGDVVVEKANAGADTVRASLSYTLGANVENLVLIGSDDTNGVGNDLNNTITGNSGANILDGDGGKDTLAGGAGNDRLLGGGGRDNLLGGSGNDRMEGGSGNDRLTGNSGADILFGGSGADRFIFTAFSDSTVSSSGRDVIKDFSRSEGDLFDLSLLDASSKASGNQAFSFIGEATSFNGKAGELRYATSGGDTFIHADVDGDRKSDFSIRIDADIDLVKGDFIL